MLLLNIIQKTASPCGQQLETRGMGWARELSRRMDSGWTCLEATFHSIINAEVKRGQQRAVGLRRYKSWEDELSSLIYHPGMQDGAWSHPGSSPHLLCDFREWTSLSYPCFPIHKVKIIIAESPGCCKDKSNYENSTVLQYDCLGTEMKIFSLRIQSQKGSWIGVIQRTYFRT